MSFNGKYQKIRNLAEGELSAIEKKIVEFISVREPINSDIVEFLLAPSKRIRSVLAILYARACGEILSEKQLEFLAAVELVHNASLIHDDIIDESKFRRGVETISCKFGNKLGVIAGDYLLSVAMEKIVKIGSIEIFSKFVHTLKQMCIGEINQNFDRFKIGTIDNYIEKSKNKTAYLFETALEGCMFLAQKQYDLSEIKELGLNIGIAFQIRDDITNLTNTDKSKPINNDITEGIYNAPIIYSGSIEDYKSGIEKTRALLNNYIKRAMQQVEKLPNNDYKTALEDFLELLNNE